MPVVCKRQQCENYVYPLLTAFPLLRLEVPAGSLSLGTRPEGWSAVVTCSSKRVASGAGASVDALRAEWWNQPATNQTAEPRTAGTDGGAAGPMLDPHSVLDRLWGGRQGKLTEVGSGEYDVPQVRVAQQRRDGPCAVFSGLQAV